MLKVWNSETQGMKERNILIVISHLFIIIMFITVHIYLFKLHTVNTVDKVLVPHNHSEINHSVTEDSSTLSEETAVEEKLLSLVHSGQENHQARDLAWKESLKSCQQNNHTSQVQCAFDLEMKRRRNLMEKKCDEHEEMFDDEEEKINTHKLYVLAKRRLIWCPVFKAASTNWLKNIPSLSGLSSQYIERLVAKKRQPNILARAIVPHISRENLIIFLNTKPTPTSFIIVRHPFDRLLSAYRDKLEKYRGYYFRMYGKNMAKKFRAQGIARFGKDFYDRQGQNGSPISVKGRSGREPTFWEFVTAVLEDGIMDEHWEPMVSLCSVCGMSYDYVLRFEQLEEEEKYFLQRLGLQGLVVQRWENRNHAGPVTHHIRQVYFNMLSVKEVLDLHMIYQMDFKVFGYELDPVYLPNVTNIQITR